MCESNVYILKDGREDLVLEKVDRIIPGEEDNIFLENVFGERKVIKARIKEMELVHHRILLTEVGEEESRSGDQELWLEPLTDHGHFHPGEEVRLQLCKGHNMHPLSEIDQGQTSVYLVKHDGQNRVEFQVHHGRAEINLGAEAEGLITVWAWERDGKGELYAKLLVEIGHHDHQALEPAGLPLEIVPVHNRHPHLGEHYEIMVLKDGKPLAGTEVAATYSGNRQSGYPVKTVTDDQGRARVFLSARGNYLFKVQDGSITSTFTLIKSF